ncbi:MAG: hypothetical protein K2Q22_08535, partial [Cytophagales bacterium]|nr:hypothetical protein [Cytophagales bacterium]
MKLNKGEVYGLGLLFLLVLFLAVYRNIEFLKNPTFFAEEGTYFYAQAFQNGWASIWKTYSGYLQLPQTFIVTLAAQWCEIENAPLFTAICSILVTMIPVGIICFGNSVFHWSFVQKCALSIATVVCSNDANSYSVIHFNFIFSWITALILFESEKEGMKPVNQYFYCFLLLLAPLSGPVSTFLWPFFAYNYFKERNSYKLSFLIALSIGVAISVGFFLHNLMFNATEEYNDRFRDFNAGYFFLKYFIQSLVGNSFGYFEEINRVVALVAFFLLL